MIMIVQKAIGVTDPGVMCIHMVKEVQEKEAAVIELLSKHNAPYESTSPKFIPKVYPKVYKVYQDERATRHVFVKRRNIYTTILWIVAWNIHIL